MRPLAYTRATAPSPALLHYRCAVPIHAKQFVMVLSNISQMVMVPSRLGSGDPELLALYITFALAVDIFLIKVEDIRQ